MTRMMKMREDTEENGNINTNEICYNRSRNEDSSKPIKKAKSIKSSKRKRERKHKDKSMTTKPLSLEVYHIPSEDENCSQGMKKWVSDYYQSRPGLEVLQKRIDDFITKHEEEQEQERREREEEIKEGGWTVVTQHKGRKRTTDPESGVAIGAVSETTVLDKKARKKSTEVGVHFYRFQRREAQRSEVMKLQTRLEDDKRRIQQLRASRKFRPS